MDLAEIRERLAEIEASRRDPEVAHGVEDKLYLAVLRAIAEGKAGADEAREALKANDIQFARWCA